MKIKENTETQTVKQFIIILLIVILIAVGIYFFTKKFVTKDSNTTDNTETKEYINPNVAIVGTMLSKNASEYYVMLYKSTDTEASSYLGLIDSYDKLENSIPVYTVDLSNPLNSKYYDLENPNLDTTNTLEMRFGKITVLKINNGNIEKSYSTVEEIKKVWKIS